MTCIHPYDAGTIVEMKSPTLIHLNELTQVYEASENSRVEFRALGGLNPKAYTLNST